jgi:hypothetical protein
MQMKCRWSWINVVAHSLAEELLRMRWLPATVHGFPKGAPVREPA